MRCWRKDSYHQSIKYHQHKKKYIALVERRMNKEVSTLEMWSPKETKKWLSWSNRLPVLDHKRNIWVRYHSLGTMDQRS
jgi:23S rRNA-/tRNA-specific pseudouridylate synthase